MIIKLQKKPTFHMSSSTYAEFSTPLFYDEPNTSQFGP